MNVSVVIPVYNAEKSIESLVAEIHRVMGDIGHEIVLVNDGSRDRTESICERLAGQDKRIRFISLRRNFGEHNAVLCGLNFAAGDVSVIIDDDFQNPPSEIPKLLREMDQGHDVVYSRYDEKRHSPFRNLGSAVNDWFATRLLAKPKDLYLSSFKAIRGDLVKEIIQYKGPFPYIDGLILRATDRIGWVTVEHDERRVGRSNYTMGKLVSLYMNMFFNFSIRPLRMFTLAGCAIFVFGMVSSIAFVVEKLMHPQIAVGWTSLITAVLTLSGFQIMFLGLLGEYLGKQYLDQNRTPQWVIKGKILNSADE